MVDLLIVGGGAAGMACAVGAGGDASVLLADAADRLGGVLPQCLHDGFGVSLFGESLTGPEFLRRLSREYDALPIETALQATVLRICPDRTALLSGPDGLRRVAFRRLVLAAGSRERSLFSMPAGGARPQGVYPAGLAQQLLNLDGRDLGTRFLILGGGDVGLVMAGRLHDLGKTVLAVVEQNPRPGGLPCNRQRFLTANGIPLRCNTVLSAVRGTSRVTGAVLRRLDSGETEEIACDCILTAFGLIPERALLEGLGDPPPDWLFLTGNCERIHDRIDLLVRESRALGRTLSRLR